MHRIADHAKYVYAVGARGAVALQQKLALLADTGKIDIEAHNKLQHHACYQMGEEVYSSTTSSLHDQNIWDGGWDWDDNTYSDGRQVMTQVRIKGWLELEREWTLTLRNKDIVIYGDGRSTSFRWARSATSIRLSRARIRPAGPAGSRSTSTSSTRRSPCSPPRASYEQRI